MLLSKLQLALDPCEARSVTKTIDYTMKNSDFAIFADATRGPVHITLPEPSNEGRLIFIQKVDGSDNPVFVKCAEGERASRISLLKATSCYEGWMLIADGLKTWSIVSRSANTH